MKTFLAAICLVVATLPACHYHDDDDHDFDHWFRTVPIDGSGTIVSENRSLPPFDSVDLRAVADVRLTEGGSQSVLVETDDNILPHLLTTVSGNVLSIETDVDYRSARGVSIVIEMTDVQSVRLIGVGSIHGSNISSTGEVRAALLGVGNIFLSGAADSFDGTNSGVGTMEAEHLRTRRSTIHSSGVGDSRTTATDELWVVLSGYGNVYYGGGPPLVRSTVTGTGRLIPV